MDAKFILYDKQIEKLIELKQLQTERIERIRKSLERKESFLYNYGKSHFNLDWSAFRKLQEKHERNMLLKRLNLSSPIASSQVHDKSSVFDSPQSSYESKISVVKIAENAKSSTSELRQVEQDEQKMIEILEDFEVKSRLKI
jgi:hypothetical protein